MGWAGKLESSAAQAASERVMSAIRRFYENCKAQVPGKKGYPKFQKNNRSVEYKVAGWKLSPDRKRITFTDKFKAGTFKLVGSYDLNFYHLKAIKRVRIVRRSDGYYCQQDLRRATSSRVWSREAIVGRVSSSVH